MSASSFISHTANTINLFPSNPTKFQTPFPSFNPSKFNFTILSNPHNNCSNSTENENSRIQHETQNSHPKSSKPMSNSSSTIKAHTAPWMNSPLVVKPNEILKFSKQKIRKDDTFGNNGQHADEALTGKVGGGRGRLAMKEIFKSIDKLKEQNSEEIKKIPEKVKFKFAPDDLWGNGNYENDPEIEETVEFDVPLGEVERGGKLKMLPWQREERTVIVRVNKERVLTAAELTLDQELLKRLRIEAAEMRNWVKVKKAGVTKDVVDQVKSIWRSDELALIHFDVPLCRNMERAREIVEMKTGGLVVWRNKDFLAVYRGRNAHKPNNSSSNSNCKNNPTITGSSFDPNYQNSPTKPEFLASLYERESDRLLDGLGPRFVDWWMQKPLPVDADLLPELVPGFMTPLRIKPPFTKSKINDSELTYLRKLAQALPTHFVIGRNRKLQGLASAILKLWEKCHIAKIAVKWGVPNTDDEQMAFELKKLTGGVLLLRNKFLIILYRGKDFIPSELATLVSERELELTECQIREENARIKASEMFYKTCENLPEAENLGTLSEFNSIQSGSSNVEKGKIEVELQMEVDRRRLEKELKDQQWKLFLLRKKIDKSSEILEKLKRGFRFSDKDLDQEMLSEEERECLREMGLKMDRSLVLGRRGVFDGVIEGMHQHWKHREIVKVITMQKTYSRVVNTAKYLESESGGVIISIVQLKVGHAIIIYRGKNYKRPIFTAQNLLNKSEALARSIELQRIGSLKFFAKQREQTIYDLEQKLAEFTENKN